MPEAGSPEGRKPVAAPTAAAGSQAEFAAQVLAALGAPASQGNIAVLLAWFKREGTKAQFNPMATTLKYGSYTEFNSVGVKNYADQATGVQATAKTLQSPRYAGIVADLRADNPQGAANNHPQEFKTWSGGGYDRLVVGDVGGTIGGQPITTAGAAYTPSTGALPPNATPAQIETYIRANYPQAAGFLDVPEIRTVLIKAAQENWTPTKLQAEVQATQWWRNNSDSTRQYLSLLSTDPASAEKMVQQKMAELRPEFEQLGSDASLRAVAEASLKYGWTDARIKENFAGHLQYDLEHGGLKQGSVADVTADNLATIARTEYFVPLSPQDTGQWAVDIYSGKKTEDEFRDYLANQAEARFPGLKAQGITPGQYLAPIRNVIADTLELQPGDVDLLDRRYSTVLQVPGDKGSRPMTISEAQTWARSQPAYQYTKGAMDEASQFVEFLGNKFGKIAS